MRVLVTGSAGFVGRHVRNALQASDYEVVTDLDIHDASEDLADEGVATKLVRASVPDVIIHLAARVASGDDPWKTVVSANQLATLRVLEAVQRDARQARVLVASSSAVYGPVARERNPVREAEATRPVTLYGASKAGAEAIAFAFAASGLRVTVCRPFNIIGPGGDKRSALAQWTRQLIGLKESGAGRVFQCGPLNTFRDLTDVRDIARAYVAIVDRGATDPVLNLCSGRAIEGRHLLELLFDAAGIHPPVVSAPARGDDILYQSGDPSCLIAATGWQPAIPLAETVHDVLQEHIQAVA